MAAVRQYRRMSELLDVTGSSGPGMSPVGDGSEGFPLTRVATEDDVNGILVGVASVEYHGYGLARQPPLEGGFRNYGPPYAQARYRLNANNNLSLQGLVCRDEPLTEQTPILKLPVGCTPDKVLIFMAASAGSVSRIDIHPDGTVIWFEHLVGTDAHTYLSLSGITFSVAPPFAPTVLPV